MTPNMICFMDNLSAHVNVEEVLTRAATQKVQLLTFPPHHTHILQPGDHHPNSAFKVFRLRLGYLVRLLVSNFKYDR